MNLPYPFEKASALMPDTQGSISLIDAQGKRLAQIPLSTAFELSMGAEGFSFGDGVGFGFGYGDGDGSGYGFGSGYGYGDGSGRSK